MYSNINYGEFDRRVFLILSGSAVINATITLVMVTLPFLLLGLGVSFAYMGVVEAVALLTNYAARIPAKIYAERNGSEAGIVSGLIAMGISMIFLFLSSNLSLIFGAVFLINVSYTVFYYGIKTKLTRRFEGSEADVWPSNYSLFNAMGPAAALIIAAVYIGSGIRIIYGGMSLVLIFMGVISLLLLKFNKPTRGGHRSMGERFRELITKPLIALDDIQKIRERDFLLVLTVIQLVTTLSIGSVMVFMPAMAIRDGLSFQSILFLFAIVGIASFGLKYIGRLFRNDFTGRMFFLSRPLFLLIVYIIISMGFHSILFIMGYSIMAVWYLLEPGSDYFVRAKFRDGDPERMVYLSSLFSRPVTVIAPLMGAILWVASPRLMFAIAIFPALVALLLSHLIVNRPDLFKPSRRRLFE